VDEVVTAPPERSKYIRAAEFYNSAAHYDRRAAKAFAAFELSSNPKDLERGIQAGDAAERQRAQARLILDRRP
jgi:hypothetical protein